jgi:hypothetical protein
MMHAGEGKPDDLTVRARLTNRSFLGSVTRVSLDTGTAKLHANLPAAAICRPTAKTCSCIFRATALHVLVTRHDDGEPHHSAAGGGAITPLSDLLAAAEAAAGTDAAPPLLWLGIIYIGSLFALLLQSFFSLDDFTGQVKYELTLAPMRSSSANRTSTSSSAR